MTKYILKEDGRVYYKEDNRFTGWWVERNKWPSVNQGRENLSWDVKYGSVKLTSVSELDQVQNVIQQHINTSIMWAAHKEYWDKKNLLTETEMEIDDEGVEPYHTHTINDLWGSARSSDQPDSGLFTGLSVNGTNIETHTFNIKDYERKVKC